MKSYIFIAIGAVVFSAGAALAVIDHVDTSWPRVAGAVIGSRVVNESAAPLVEYDANGTKFQVIASDRPLIGTFKDGTSVTVAYNPASPGEAKIPAAGVLLFFTWLLVVAGAVFVVVGSVLRKRLQDDSSDDSDIADSDDEVVHQV